MTSDDLKDKVVVSLGILSSSMTDDIYGLAEAMALSELKWTLPIDETVDPFKMIWMVKRAKRHVVEIFLTQSAESIKHKQSSHDQKFDHYRTLIRDWDNEFKQALEDNYELFAGVDATQIFGTHVKAGFVYDGFGNDITSFLNGS